MNENVNSPIPENHQQLDHKSSFLTKIKDKLSENFGGSDRSTNHHISKDLATPEYSESIEFDLPLVSIPDNPTEEELQKFFTPEMVSRLIYCPKINKDQTDSWGMFGYEPGFFFIKTNQYKGKQTINDDLFLQGKSFETYTSETGYELSRIEHNDFLPRDKFNYSIITRENTPKTFDFLRKLIDGVKTDDLLTYPTEDLELMLDDSNNKLFYKNELITKKDYYKRQYESFGESYEQKLAGIEERISQNLPQRFNIITEIVKRGNTLEKIGTSYEKENQLLIESGIDQNPQLYKDIQEKLKKLNQSLPLNSQQQKLLESKLD